MKFHKILNYSKKINKNKTNFSTNNTSNKTEKRKSKLTFSFFDVIIIICISLLLGGLVGAFVTITKSNHFDSNLQEFYATYNSLVTEYYKKINKKELIDAAIDGMVGYLGDPYSVFMDDSETEDFNTTVNGEYKGLGISVSYVDNKITVVSLYDSSPAKKAGIKEGDVITKVNNKAVSNKELDDVVKMITSNSKVSLVILRDGVEKKYNINLSNITIPSVESKTIEKNNKKVGVITVSVFAANTYKQFLEKLNGLEKKDIDSLIIDVRDNPGGHLDQVTKVLSLFLNKKKVIYQIEDINKKRKKVYSSSDDKRTYPIVVLINKNSASASEILAGAMKESYKATIVGIKSYGKGTVQKEYSLSSGSSIKYTTDKWLTPNGNSINKKGIEPTISIDLSDEYKNNPSEDLDNQLQTALDVLTK